MIFLIGRTDDKNLNIWLFGPRPNNISLFFNDYLGLFGPFLMFVVGLPRKRTIHFADVMVQTWTPPISPGPDRFISIYGRISKSKTKYCLPALLREVSSRIICYPEAGIGISRAARVLKSPKYRMEQFQFSHGKPGSHTAFRFRKKGTTLQGGSIRPSGMRRRGSRCWPNEGRPR